MENWKSRWKKIDASESVFGQRNLKSHREQNLQQEKNKERNLVYIRALLKECEYMFDKDYDCGNCFIYGVWLSAAEAEASRRRKKRARQSKKV